MSPPRAPSAYLKSELTRPLPTKDGGTLRTVAEACTYMLALPKDRDAVKSSMIVTNSGLT